MSVLPLEPGARIPVRALLLGQHLDTRKLELGQRLANLPLTVAAGENGLAVMFRYGALVLFNVSATDEGHLIERLRPHLNEPFPHPETESLTLMIDSASVDKLEDDLLILQHAEVEHLQIVAEILATSVALADYEVRISATFDRIEPFAHDLMQHGRGRRKHRQLVQQIGEGLLNLHRMVGRVEVGDKPELLWERPDLERLYHRLEDEFEIRERHVALERKLDVINRTAEAQLELLQAKRSLRVEWYITILIVIEIFITLYELFIHGK